MIIQSVTQITSIYRPKYLIILDILTENILYYLKIKRLIVEVFVIRYVLVVTYISAAGLLKKIYGIEAVVPKELLTLPQGRYIIVANHRKAIDTYLILATLPFPAFYNLLPIRFFTANIFLKYWWQRLFLIPYGSFRAYSTEDKISGVKGGLYLSDRGQSLFIFPEGKRMRNGAKRELKVGVAYLAQRRDFTILPVYINYSKKTFFKKTKVSWGKPFKIEDASKSQDLEKLTSQIFSKVLNLSTKT